MPVGVCSFLDMLFLRSFFLCVPLFKILCVLSHILPPPSFLSPQPFSLLKSTLMGMYSIPIVMHSNGMVFNFTGSNEFSRETPDVTKHPSSIETCCSELNSAVASEC